MRWRQTEGLLRSIIGLLGLAVGVPDHTTFSRRSPGLVPAYALGRAQTSTGSVHVVIDATGLKVYGAGEWLVEKHGARGRREWRKLHLAVDPGSGVVLACELTSDDEGDASQVAPLPGQISGPLGAVVADGAYDGEPAYQAVAERQSEPPIAVVIPPCSTAVPSTNAETTPSQRDGHIALIRDKGRIGWQKAVGYGRRSLGETAMFRYKALTGPGLRARRLAAQKTEARVGCTVLNRMTQLGKPISHRIVPAGVSNRNCAPTPLPSPDPAACGTGLPSLHPAGRITSQMRVAAAMFLSAAGAGPRHPKRFHGTGPGRKREWKTRPTARI